MTTRIYISALVVFVLSSCTSLDIDQRHAASPVWATEGESPRRANAVPQRIAPPLEQTWDFNAGAGFGSVSPLILGDIILVATRKGEVHAIDMTSGNRVGQAEFGDSIEGTPVYADGTLIVPLAWGSVALHAHNLLSGTRHWRVKGPPVTSGLLVYDGSVVAGDVEGTVRAYRLQDGTEAWSREMGGRTSILSSPVVTAGRLVVADDAGKIAALNASDGSLIWSADAGAPVQVSLAADEEAVYAATTRGRLTVFDAETGTVKWEYAVPNGDVYFSAPAVGEWEVIFGASDGVVRALDVQDGSTLWTTDVVDAVTAPPVITDDAVYVGTMGGELIALGRGDGSRTWSTELEGRVKSAFAVKGSRLVVMAEPRLVYLFEPSSDAYASR